jgi:hypothetical protein
MGGDYSDTSKEEVESSFELSRSRFPYGLPNRLGYCASLRARGKATFLVLESKFLMDGVDVFQKGSGGASSFLSSAMRASVAEAPHMPQLS